MSMIKRFYEAETIVIEFYSNARVRKMEFKRNDDGSYAESYETIDGRGKALERTKLTNTVTIDEVEASCNRVCEHYEVISIHIE